MTKARRVHPPVDLIRKITLEARERIAVGKLKALDRKAISKLKK